MGLLRRTPERAAMLRATWEGAIGWDSTTLGFVRVDGQPLTADEAAALSDARHAFLLLVEERRVYLTYEGERRLALWEQVAR